MSDDYMPFLCMNGHRITIDSVLPNGRCDRCGGEVKFASSPEEAREALIQDLLGPRVSLIDSDGAKHKMTQKECTHCHNLFSTPYPSALYCPRGSCRDDARKARQENGVCKACKKSFRAPDRRYKYCTRPACIEASPRPRRHRK